jgi:hypothetical protein
MVMQCSYRVRPHRGLFIPDVKTRPKFSLSGILQFNMGKTKGMLLAYEGAG